MHVGCSVVCVLIVSLVLCAHTILQKAYQDGMAKIQSKLKETFEKGSSSSIPSLTKITNLFHADDNNTNKIVEDVDPSTSELPSNNIDDDDNNSIMAIDAMETTAAAVATTSVSSSSSSTIKGENSAAVKRTLRKGKRSLRKASSSTTAMRTKRERPKPRFFCQFT